MMISRVRAYRNQVMESRCDEFQVGHNGLQPERDNLGSHMEPTSHSRSTRRGSLSSSLVSYKSVCSSVWVIGCTRSCLSGPSPVRALLEITLFQTHRSDRVACCARPKHRSTLFLSQQTVRGRNTKVSLSLETSILKVAKISTPPCRGMGREGGCDCDKSLRTVSRSQAGAPTYQLPQSSHSFARTRCGLAAACDGDTMLDGP